MGLSLSSRLVLRLPMWLGCICLVAALLAGCTEPMTYHGDIADPYANYDALCKTVGERYCFLRQKGIDWDSLSRAYRADIKPDMSRMELFYLMSDLLDNLRDGHVNLNAPFATSYYKKWWSDYPQDFDERTLQEYYLKFGGLQKSGMTYAVFAPDTIGYLRIPSFSVAISPTVLDYILAYMHRTKGLIIDVRDNGGGYLTNVPELAGRFLDHKIVGGYIRHKTGPGPDDFSEPFAVEYEPVDTTLHIGYKGRPVLVLTNRSCYSAANDFVSVMKELPNVRIVGARTGGGGGLPFSSQLPIGWSIRFSSCPVNDAHDRITEFGIDPDVEVHCTPQQFADGIDTSLDTAFSIILK